MRKSKITNITTIRNETNCVLSREYIVYYSNGVHRKYPEERLTLEMHKFLMERAKEHKFAAQLLANEIEQFMFERGEYDFHLEDRIRWLISDDRKGNAGYIRDEILKDNISFITNYLTSEISSMCEDDELIPKAEKLLEELNDF